MHCFKMLLFLFSAIEITTLHTHITKFMPNVEAKKCWIQIFSLAGKLYLHNILHLVEIEIVLPILNAKVERAFSTFIVSSPSGIRGGMIFVSSARQGGNCWTSRARVGTHSGGGEMILGSQAGGNCFIMTNCWYFHKMLHLEFYKFCLRCYLIFF